MRNTDFIALTRVRTRADYLQALLDYSPDIIVAGDKEGRIVEFNKGAEQLLGYKKAEILGKQIKLLYVNPEERERILQIVKKQGKVIDYETTVKTKHGRIIPISTTVAHLKDKNGEVIGTIGIAKDIRRRKAMEKKLVKLTVTDGLTGLYTRGYFNRRINQAVKESAHFKKPLALIMLDLDGFKKYNDTQGHLEGDKILHKIGRIILRTIRHRVDSCYRFGGDEFVIIIPGKYQSVAREIAEELRVEIDLAFGPTITASIGVAKYQFGQSVYDFIRSADIAMYKAKSAGGNRVGTND